jgi:hypothetical protein
MDKISVSRVLCEVVKEYADQDGWANLVNIGNPLKSKGVDFKALGYEKLFALIRDHKETFDWKVDKESKPGVFIIYAREKSEFSKKKFASLAQQPQISEEATGLNDPHAAMIQWASFGNWKSTIAGLNALCLPERWGYKDLNPNNPYPILSNYLKYTFYRLSKENGKILINDKYAAFNTGLVDRRYEPI